MVCDFCKSTEVRWSYPANDFAIGVGGLGSDGSVREVIAVGSDGSWAACSVCHALIERNDRAGVLRRAVETSEREGSMLAFPELRPVLLTTLAMVHARFFENRTGPALPFE